MHALFEAPEVNAGVVLHGTIATDHRSLEVSVRTFVGLPLECL
jgi:hypothetical protein